jgi:hypothetical protein
MPSRQRLTPTELLGLITGHAGRKDAGAAKRLLALADMVGAQQIGRQASISVRFLAPERVRQPLTLFLVQNTGLVTVWYTYLWERAGVPRRIAKEYDGAWKNLLGPDVLDRGVPAAEVVARWGKVAELVTAAVTSLEEYLGVKPSNSTSPVAKSLGALEGVMREVQSYRRSRSKRLRNAALHRAAGCCEACDVAFGTMLKGRGSHVLQVHHVDQLALRDHPSVTKVEQLVVVCANCHLLIHADAKNAMTLGALRSLWRSERRTRMPRARGSA